MHGTLQRGELRSNKRRPVSGPQKIPLLPLAFGQLARFAYPVKTLAALGHVSGAGRTTIKNWLNGTHEPPAFVLALCTAEIMRRLAGQ